MCLKSGDELTGYGSGSWLLYYNIMDPDPVQDPTIFRDFLTFYKRIISLKVKKSTRKLAKQLHFWTISLDYTVMDVHIYTKTSLGPWALKSTRF